MAKKPTTKIWVKALEVANKLLELMAADNDLEIESDEPARVLAAVIRPAIAAGWKPKSKDLENLAIGDEDEIAKATAKIPGGIGAEIHKTLDAIFNDEV